MKTLLAILILTLLIGFLVGCTPGNEDKHASYTIGDIGPGGGMVFYDKGRYVKGWRYLEVSASDVGKASWGCMAQSIRRAKGVDVGSGKSNTDAILRACDEERTAARLCAEYLGGGKDDWYLPSKEELYLIRMNLHTKGIGEFDDGFYWSSSEINNIRAWNLFFISGNWSNVLKISSERVRAVRAF